MHTLLRHYLSTTDAYTAPWLYAVAGFGSIPLGILAIMGEVRLAFAVVALTSIAGLACLSVRWAILATFAYLTVLGDLRRWVLAFDAWSGADPLLVVGPAAAMLFAAAAFTDDRLRFDTPLSKGMLLLIGIMVLQIFNPRQGGLLVGVAGAGLMIVPLLWYWVGHAFGSDEFVQTLFLRLVVPLAGLAALFGFFQVAYGYPEYQLEWYRTAGYSALGPSEAYLRPLSVFANITEYCRYLGFAILALFALVLKRKSPVLALSGICVLFVALFLTGTRGPVLLLIVSAGIMWTVMGRTVSAWIPRFAVAVTVGLFGLVYVLTQVSEVDGTTRAHHTIERQADLIPEGEAGGPASVHLNLFRIAGVRTMEDPLGHGVGYVTLAASRFGGTGFSSEKDMTDMFIALGVPGGLVYLGIVGYAAYLAVSYWRRRRSITGLIIGGVLVFSVFSWLKPAHYVATPLLWFCVGALDRMHTAAPKDGSGTASASIEAGERSPTPART